MQGEALEPVAPERGEGVDLGSLLHPFGDHHELEGVGEVDHRLHHGGGRGELVSPVMNEWSSFTTSIGRSRSSLSDE